MNMMLQRFDLMLDLTYDLLSYRLNKLDPLTSQRNTLFVCCLLSVGDDQYVFFELKVERDVCYPHWQLVVQ